MTLRLILVAGCATWLASSFVNGMTVNIVEDAQAKAAIFAPARVMNDATPEPGYVWRDVKASAQQARLRESVKDLAACLQKISGAKIDIVTGAPAADEKRIAILIGDLAQEKFGAPKKPFAFRQGFRVVVSPTAIGLWGESDLATSYAIYELLDRLGCRWYMPSEMGEVLPHLPTIALEEIDVSLAPSTIFRGIIYADNAYARRNRLGGLQLNMGHALEMYLDKADREKHPEWRATVKGKTDPHRLKWSAPGLVDAIAEKIVAQAKKDPEAYSFSLSPDDGLGYDDSPEDRALDANDFDASLQGISLTDRLIGFCNKIVDRVTVTNPDLLFGVLAYVPYSRPPVREKLRPNLIPTIAPITFSRAHPMTDDGEPNNKDLRAIVEGWGKAAPRVSYYFYGWFLAEPSAPNPMIRKWSTDIPIIYKNSCVFWQPETITNFESSMHAIYLGDRMAWDTSQDPKAIIDELNTKFYGAAAKEMAAYWTFIDSVWVDTPEYAGCGFGHLRRWNPTQMAQARKLMDAAVAAAKVEPEKSRVKLADESLRVFEHFMKMRHDLADGRWTTIGTEAKSYIDQLIVLADRHQPQYAFGKMYWTKPEGINGVYFNSFYRQTYDDAARVANGFTLITQQPMRQWHYQVDKEKQGEKAGWNSASFDDHAWKTTDVMTDTWSALGLHNYMDSVWYRQTVEIPKVPTGKKVFLWVGATDGSVKVFVNGQHVRFTDSKGQTQDEFSGYCSPASFDITSAINQGSTNTIALLCTRTDLNELGTGGLLAPVGIYREKD